ncbi:hypothetical protein [Methylosinus sp. Sm6]|uniref:hypothetical protein n=1 Tax=Methylosinus sp. Sm6 TaxID=2866948 RepID=UPI001C9938E8|nr:hypothetical protein [Methylosinus sp. Sm6]MBY6242863.1 hypothetical protein [Methylosinus sp. Sm6]
MVFQFINDVPVSILYRLKPNLYLWPDTIAGRIMPLALYVLTAGAFGPNGAWRPASPCPWPPSCSFACVAAPLLAAFFPLAAILVAGLAVSQDRAVKRVAC